MAMAAGPWRDDEGELMATINTTPLVDVMLVLLIIFLITIPVVTASIPIALPKERAALRETRPGNIVISVDRQGGIFWHDAKLADGQALLAKLQAAARQDPQPAVQIRGDLGARYEAVGRVLSACQRAGITRVAFITEPPPMGG